MARGISLRDFRPEDASAVHRWFNSPAATANLLEHRDEFSEEAARRWVERAIEQANDPDAEDRKWAVEVEGIDEPVGYTALYGLNRQTAPELGAIIGDERVRGRGVGREAERLTNLKAFEEFGAHKVYGRIPATNEAAGGGPAQGRPPRGRADRRRALGRISAGSPRAARRLIR